jgi:NAD(P)-dependent dehydrogenase (short-subunit alcohol dehydrogenase family)
MRALLLSEYKRLLSSPCRRRTLFSIRICAEHSSSPSRLIPHGGGRIINIGSVTSVMGYAGLGPYGASRGGIRQLTMSLTDDWGPHGITVNCLAPSWFKTEQNKVMYEDPEWMASLVDRIQWLLFLCRQTALLSVDQVLRTVCTTTAFSLHRVLCVIKLVHGALDPD